MNTLDPGPGVLTRLSQAHHWTSYGDNGQLVEHRLDDMTDDHRRRVLHWLRTHAHDLHRDQADRLAHRYRRGHLTRLELEAELTLLRALHPEEWLDQQPLVHRLQQLVPRRAGVGAGILRRIRGWRA